MLISRPPPRARALFLPQGALRPRTTPEAQRARMYVQQITDEMIDAAARAIREQACARSISRHARPKPFDDLPPTLQASYRAEAQAALTAALQAQA